MPDSPPRAERSMHGFTPDDLVVSGEYYAIYRRGAVVGMTVWGPVDDARSDGWRAALAGEFARGGYPRFYAMDVSRADASLSLPARYRTVAFVVATLRRVERAALLARGRTETLPLVRAMLRVVAMPNIVLCIEDETFRRRVDEMFAV